MPHRDELVLTLLSTTRQLLLNRISTNEIQVNRLNGTSFQEHVLDAMGSAAIGTAFEGKVSGTGKHAFPDIIVDSTYGVEVKMTEGDKWTSLGNSVLESSKVSGLETIFMFFGKLGGTPDILFRHYHECLSEVGVTHYPRYKIDMRLSFGASIFDKMGVPYDILSNSGNVVKQVKAYYREQLREGESLWWIDSDSDSDTGSVHSPIIKRFDSLASIHKERFLLDCFILFPEILGSSQTKFERPAAYLFAEFGVISPNLRDKFTAGGQKNIPTKRIILSVPQIFRKLYDKAREIETQIEEMNSAKLREYWELEDLPLDRVAFWKTLLDRKAHNKCLGGLQPSEVFELGLRRSS